MEITNLELIVGINADYDLTFTEGNQNYFIELEEADLLSCFDNEGLNYEDVASEHYLWMGLGYKEELYAMFEDGKRLEEQ